MPSCYGILETDNVFYGFVDLQFEKNFAQEWVVSIVSPIFDLNYLDDQGTDLI